MTVRFLTLFFDQSVIAYVLTPHTAGAPQPCDIVLFPKFKEKHNSAIAMLVSHENSRYAYYVPLLCSYVHRVSSFLHNMAHSSFTSPCKPMTTQC